MSSPHVTESIPAYALGILDEAENHSIARHLAGCSACQAELRSYQLVAEQLAGGVPQRNPPVGLRAAILQKAAAATVLAPRPAPLAWLRALARPLSPLAGALGLVVIFVLVGLNLALWQQLRQATSANTPVAEFAEFRLVRMSAPDKADVTGLLVIDEEGDFGTLVVDGLKPLSQEQQYQLWLIKDGKRTSGGVFSVQDSGYGMLRVDSPIPLIQYQSFGVTIEPAGGSPGPTGPKVLGGSL